MISIRCGKLGRPKNFEYQNFSVGRIPRRVNHDNSFSKQIPPTNIPK